MERYIAPPSCQTAASTQGAVIGFDVIPIAIEDMDFGWLAVGAQTGIAPAPAAGVQGKHKAGGHPFAFKIPCGIECLPPAARKGDCTKRSGLCRDKVQLLIRTTVGIGLDY